MPREQPDHGPAGAQSFGRQKIQADKQCVSSGAQSHAPHRTRACLASQPARTAANLPYRGRTAFRSHLLDRPSRPLPDTNRQYFSLAKQSEKAGNAPEDQNSSLPSHGSSSPATSGTPCGQDCNGHRDHRGANDFGALIAIRSQWDRCQARACMFCDVKRRGDRHGRETFRDSERVG